LETNSLKKEIFIAYSKNELFQGVGISKEFGEEVLVTYWKLGAEKIIQALPANYKGIKIKHIITGEFKQF